MDSHWENLVRRGKLPIFFKKAKFSLKMGLVYFRSLKDINEIKQLK